MATRWIDRCRKGALAFALGMGLVLAAGAVSEPVAEAKNKKVVVIKKGPPGMRVEVKGAAPGPHHIWVPGFWSWGGNTYVWVPGSWQLAPRGTHIWIAPHYRRTPQGYIYAPGHWK